MRIPSKWDHVFMEMAYITLLRSKDPSTQVGSILTDKNHIVLGTGFNGPPPQLDDNLIPWDVRPDKYDYVIHAEENALLFALESHGKFPLRESTLYCTHEPCPACVLRAVRLYVGKIIYPSSAKDYPLKKFITDYNNILDKQMFPKTIVEMIDYKFGDIYQHE
jgi:deoxycytidylate deaminase